MRYLAIASAAALAALIASAHAVADRANAARPMTNYTKMAQAPVAWVLHVVVSVEGEEVASLAVSMMTPDGPALMLFESESACRENIEAVVEKFTPIIKGRFGDNAEVKVSCIVDES